ncbi:hypothetical protein [Achromobacter animicus]|uniref:hypothetical protein n=1 Tax=Achromobacter animicus TaxID=1389935 RepID=UPI0028B1527C|nr:hypothetical protein [Achromobacter animicus]
MDPAYLILNLDGIEVVMPDEPERWPGVVGSNLASIEWSDLRGDRPHYEDWLWSETDSSRWTHREPQFALTATLDSAMRDLMDLATLKDDWDGMGASAPTRDILGRALGLLKALELVPPEVSAHPAGTVMFEWESDAARAYIEIGRTVFNFYIATRFSEPYAEVGSVDLLEGGFESGMPPVLRLLQSQRELLAIPQLIGTLHVDF